MAPITNRVKVWSIASLEIKWNCENRKFVKVEKLKLENENRNKKSCENWKKKLNKIMKIENL